MISLRWAEAGGTVDGTSIWQILIVIFIIAWVAALYLLPVFIANRRDMAGRGALTIVTVLFGWTGLGWFACILWSALGQTNAQKRFYENAASKS